MNTSLEIFDKSKQQMAIGILEKNYLIMSRVVITDWISWSKWNSIWGLYKLYLTSKIHCHFLVHKNYFSLILRWLKFRIICLCYILLLCHKSYKEDLLSFIIKTPALVLVIVFPDYAQRTTSYQGSALRNNLLCMASAVDKLDCFWHWPAVN